MAVILRPDNFTEVIDYYHQCAVIETRLSDFDDQNYLVNLNYLLSCYESESRLGEYGRSVIDSTIVSSLKGRLYTVDNIKKIPIP
jgi:hypothetical protein